MSGIVTQSKVPDVGQILRFLRTQNPLRPATAGDGRETVTWGYSGLNPGDRLAVSKFLQKRHQTDEAVKQDEQTKSSLTRDGEVDTTSLEQQIGRPMDVHAICRRLKTLNENFFFEPSLAFPEIMGIYYPDAEMPIYNGMRIRHIMGFESGYSPEFTVWHPEATGPKKITRGWRALILQLSAKELINFTAACRVFQIEAGRSSVNWQREVRQLRAIH